MSHYSGSRPLASATLLILGSVVALCPRDPEALDLRDQTLYVLQQFIDGVDIGVHQLIVLDLGLRDG